jgi:hypothetical protein
MHQLRRGHGKVDIISIATGSLCDNIMHQLRRGHGKVDIISIATGNPCDEITYRLNIGYSELEFACGTCPDRRAHTR